MTPIVQLVYNEGKMQGHYVTQGISGFLDFIHRPVFEGTRHFGNWI
jgi:hypothetical protein